jgi:hypothetical protein
VDGSGVDLVVGGFEVRVGGRRYTHNGVAFQP